MLDWGAIVLLITTHTEAVGYGGSSAYSQPWVAWTAVCVYHEQKEDMWTLINIRKRETSSFSPLLHFS